MKRVALLAAVVLLTFTLGVVGWQLRSVVVVFFVSWTMAASLQAPVDWLREQGLPRFMTILLPYFGVFVVFAGLTAAIIVPAVGELDPLARDLFQAYGDIQGRVLDLTGVSTMWMNRLPASNQLAASPAGEQPAARIPGLLGITHNFGYVLGQFWLAVVLAIYWSADRTRFERLWLSLLAPPQRIQARTLWRKLEAGVGGYIRSEIVQALLAGALLTAGYWLIGVRYPFVAAFLAMLAWLIPLVGGALALAPVVIIASLNGPVGVLSASLYTVVIFAFLEFFVERRLFVHERYWGVLVIVVMLAMSDILGLLGLLLAPPIALAVQVWLETVSDTTAPVPLAVPAPELPALRARLAELRTRVAQDPRQTHLD